MPLAHCRATARAHRVGYLRIPLSIKGTDLRTRRSLIRTGARTATVHPSGQNDTIGQDPDSRMVHTTLKPDVVDMPGWRPIARYALTTTLMVSLLPMAVFYAAMSLFGLRAAVLTTVGWYYAGLLLKLVRRKPVLAAALLGAGLLSIRAAVTFMTGSAFLYFIQPVACTVATATVFAATAIAGRPVLDRLAHEFCPFSDELSTRLRKARYFSRLSIVWSMTYFVNAAGTVWLLTTSSVSGFILLKTVLSPVVTVIAVVASYLVFRVTIRGQNVKIRWGHHQPWSRLAVST